MLRFFVKVIIVSDGNVSTVSLLSQVFEELEDVESLDKVLLQNIKPSSLNNSICVFCRNCLPGYGDFSRFLKSQNIPYIYYIDDNLWELKGNSPLEEYHSHPLVIESLNSFVKNASLVVASTKRLESYISRLGLNNNIVTLPNFVDSKVFDSNRLTDVSKHSKLRIGYAGSAKKVAFEPVLSALSKLQDGGYDFELEFVGFNPATKEIDFKYFEFFSSYDKYISFVKSRKWDLALAPIHDDFFSSFKTDNKYREYSALSIPAVYSNLPPYNEVIIDQHTGFLADNDSESWKNKIKLAITDSSLRKSVQRNAHDYVAKNYNLENVKQKWASVILLDEYVTPNRLHHLPGLFFLKQRVRLFVFLVFRLISLTKNEGLGVAASKLFNYFFRR